MRHKNILAEFNHVVHSRVFVDAVERAAYVTTTDDVGKMALQGDTGELWLMTTVGQPPKSPTPTPTITEIGAEPAGTAAALVASHEAAVNPHPTYATALIDHTALANPHNTGIAHISGLQTALDGKAATVHFHNQGEITGLVGALAAKANAADVYTKVESDTRYPLATGTYTKTETDAQIQAVIGAAPGALDTLNELAAALGDDPNFATTMTTQLALKANAADVYTQAQVNTALAGKSNTGHTHTPAEVGADPAGAADIAVGIHELNSDPHPQYLTQAEGDALYEPLRAQVIALASDFVITTSTNTDVTDLQFNLQPGVYAFDFRVTFQTSSTLRGIGLGVGGSLGVDRVTARVRISNTLSSETTGMFRALNSTVLSTGVDIANADMSAIVEGLVVVGTAGTFHLVFRGESSFSSTYRLMAGTYGLVRRIA